MTCTSANSDGSYDVPADWALLPSGLDGSATFRLLFVTSTTRDATATAIATYNTFVQTRAKAGHSAVTDSCGNLFKAVGSTSTVDARANTDSEATDTDAAIYWLNGPRAANDYADFYDGSWDNRLVSHARTEAGTAAGASGTLEVWTGTENNGSSSGAHLGDSQVKQGRLGTSGSPLVLNNAQNTQTKPFYALSPVFKAPANGISASLARVGSGDITEAGASDNTIEFTVTISRRLTAGEIVDVPVIPSGTDITDLVGGDYTGIVFKDGTGLNRGVSLVYSGEGPSPPCKVFLRFSGKDGGAPVQVATLVLDILEGLHGRGGRDPHHRPGAGRQERQRL